MKYVIILLSCATVAHATETQIPPLAWNLVKQAQYLDPKGSPGNKVAVVAMHAATKVLAAVFADRAINVYDTQKDVLVQRLEDQATTQIRQLAFDPEGKLLAAGDHEGNVSLWEKNNNGFQKQYLLRQDQPLDCLVFSPNSKLLAVGYTWPKCQIGIWDTSSGALVKNLARPLCPHECTNTVCFPSDYSSIAFDPTSKIIVAGTTIGCIEKWAVDTGRLLLRTNKFNRAVVAAVAWKPNGKRYALGSNNGMVCTYDSSNGKSKKVVDLGAIVGVASLEYSPDGSRVVIADRCVPAPTVLDFKNRKTGCLPNPTKELVACAGFDGSAQSVFIVDRTNTLVRWEDVTAEE